MRPEFTKADGLREQMFEDGWLPFGLVRGHFATQLRPQLRPSCRPGCGRLSQPKRTPGGTPTDPHPTTLVEHTVMGDLIRVTNMPDVLIPAGRVEPWVSNFAQRHGATELRVRDGALHGVADDGSTFSAWLPFDEEYAGPAAAAGLTAAARDLPEDWGVLLVRKGGFAVARLAGAGLVQHKIGRRHVQGRTKAGGQSQQRFARRRGNQAREAYEAAAEHAARILDGLTGPVVTGGDRIAVDTVLADPRLKRCTVVGPWLAVPDPRRAVLDQAVLDATAVRIDVHNAGSGGG